MSPESDSSSLLALPKLILYDDVLAAAALLVLVIIVAVPGLSRKFLVLPNRAVMVVGTLVFAIEALHFSVSRALHYQTWPITGSLGLAALLFSLGYVAVQSALASERRLLSIENELAIAREIQASILPSDSPVLNLRVAAAYCPMTAVAGDFYEFIPVDQNRIGFLLADVTGHGVPAALIAAMIKVAMQSVVSCAHDPREVLRGLNRVPVRTTAHAAGFGSLSVARHGESHRALWPPGIRRSCTAAKASWSASKATACCSECSRTLTTRSATCRSPR